MILDEVTSRLVAPLKFIYSSIQVSGDLVVTVPNMSAGFTCYIVQVIPIYFTWIL
jgi:hypothetical protein